MSCTIHEAYLFYVANCRTKKKVAEKTFGKLKPKFVKTMQEGADVRSAKILEDRGKV